MRSHPRGMRLALAAILALASAPAPKPPGRPLPPIAFVSREPARSGGIPGLGPAQRTLATGGRLMLREPDGTVRSLVGSGAMFDCSDPSVSFDGTRIAFAGTVHPDSAWRIWIVGVDGRGLAAVTRTDRTLDFGSLGIPAAFARYDDLDPAWVSDHLLCFASTRLPMRSQYADVPVTNLWLVREDGSGLRRITSERNGAEEPAWDPKTGGIVYARWWFNRWRAARTPTGITTDPALALPRDSINLWHAIEILPARAAGTTNARDSHDSPRLAAGDPVSRAGMMAYQPAPMPDGALAAVYATNLGLSPAPIATGVQLLRGRDPARVIAGPIVSAHAGDPYRSALRLAPPWAVSPAALPDGRIVFAYAPGGRGDFGLWVIDASGDRSRLVDLPGALEVDPAPVVRRTPRAGVSWDEEPGFGPDADRALLTGDLSSAALGRFTFSCENVFTTGGLAGAPRRQSGLGLRFFAALPRFDRAGGDTAFLLRTVPVDAQGAIRAEGLPAGVPMFEQLVTAEGAPLVAAHGPAHVPGLNFGRNHAVVRCVGCHTGHSTIPVR